MRRKLCLGIAVALFVVSSGSAAAAPVDVASEHVAVRAFDRYLRGRIADVPAARQLENAFVASITASCQGVLTPVFRLPQGSLKPDTVLAFIEEISGDLTVEIDAASHGRLARMTRALSHLPWSSKRTKATVTRFLDAQHRLLSLAPSNLCADANALAANPQVTPPGTLQWVATLGTASRATTAGNAAFLKMLGRFADASDAPVFKDIAGLPKRFVRAYKPLLKAAATKLLTTLGFPP